MSFGVHLLRNSFLPHGRREMNTWQTTTKDICGEAIVDTAVFDIFPLQDQFF